MCIRDSFEAVVGTLHRLAALLRLLLVVEMRVLLPELLLRRRDQPEVVLGVLVEILRRDRIPEPCASRASWIYFSAMCEAVPRILTSGPFDS